MPKSIIVCCDGTGNEIKEHQSNVLKFYRILRQDKTQIAYYDPGVGTISNSGAWAAFKNKAKGVFGLLTGWGLDDNVLEAYKFIINTYEDGDRIYLFGFSRGAYTVRVLAGLMKLVGLLSPHQDNLCGYALTAYKQARKEDDYKIAWRIHRVMKTRYVPIRFMGCWDTVGSVITPRPDRFYIPSLEILPFTQENPSVQTFRHAMAIDERRRMFRLVPWAGGQQYIADPADKGARARAQDAAQLWFSGVHSDIGGGYPEPESGLAKITLNWMMQEAEKNGLKFDKDTSDLLVQGINPPGSTWKYARPDRIGMLHRSAKFLWKIMEYLPKREHRIEWPQRRGFWGFYLPLFEPRLIAKDAEIHPSVWARRAGLPDYDPENLPPPDMP